VGETDLAFSELAGYYEDVVFRAGPRHPKLKVIKNVLPETTHIIDLQRFPPERGC
jgi:hypothetical protein